MEFSKLEQVQKQINLIATMIPTIHDGKKRSGLIKSIAPILEESLDGLLTSLREADSADKPSKVITKRERAEHESQEDEESTNSITDKKKTVVKDSPRKENYVRRKKTFTHEKQNGD